MYTLSFSQFSESNSFSNVQSPVVQCLYAIRWVFGGKLRFIFCKFSIKTHYVYSLEEPSTEEGVGKALLMSTYMIFMGVHQQKK